MASTIESFRNAVLAAIESAMGVAEFSITDVAWAGGGSTKFTSRRVLLSVVAHATLQDIEEQDVEISSGVFAQRLSSLEDFTIQVLAESQHDDPGSGPLDLLQKIRAGLKVSSVSEALRVAEVGLVDYPLGITPLPQTHDSRTLSSFVFDAIFRTTFEFVPGASENYGLIESVEVDGELTDDQGNTVDIETTIVHPDPAP